MSQNIRAEGEPTSVLAIDRGQLYGLLLKGKKILHDGGNPRLKKEDIKGWKHTELTMATIIGKAPFIEIDGKRYPHDQHGLSRSLPWEVEHKGKDQITFIQEYKENTQILNQKFINKGIGEKYISHPNSFALYKTAFIDKDSLEVQHIIQNTGDKDMPYQLGFHPAISRNANDKKDFIITNNMKITLKEIIETSKTGAVKLEGVDELIYVNDKHEEIYFTTKGYNNVMFWTNHESFFCVEPVTHIIKQDNHIVRPGEHYVLSPKEHAKYEFKIQT